MNTGTPSTSPGSDGGGRGVPPIQHGTYTGYTQHGRQGVPVCDACRKARNEYRNDWRQTRRDLGMDAS